MNGEFAIFKDEKVAKVSITISHAAANDIFDNLMKRDVHKNVY